MKNRSIVFKLFLLTSTLFTIIFLLFFLGQSLFLEKFYINKKVKTVQTAFEKFVDNYDKSDKSYEQVRKLKQEFHDKTNADMQFLDSNGIIKSDNNYYIDVFNPNNNKQYSIPLNNLLTPEEYNKFENLGLKKDVIINVDGVVQENNIITPQKLGTNYNQWQNEHFYSDFQSINGNPSKNRLASRYKSTTRIVFTGVITKLQLPSKAEVRLANDIETLQAVQYFADMIREGTSNSNQLSTFILDGGENIKNSIFVKPIIENGRITEYAFAIASLQPVNEAMLVLKDYYVYALIIVFLVIILLSFYYSKIIVKPLIKINRVTKKMANFDFSEKLPVTADDEIGGLSGSINTLSVNLKDRIDRLNVANTKLQQDIERERQLEKTRKEFISGVSHELKTPLSVIRSFAEGIKDGVSKDTSYYTDVILEETENMNRLIVEMLELAKLESGTYKLDMTTFSIGELTQQVYTKLLFSMEEKHLQVNIDADPSILVKANRSRIEQVVVNLLSNAIRYTPEGEKIQVSIIEAEDTVKVEIENTGNPIPEESLEKIWDRFYRLDASRSRHTGGTGLGLSIVKNILDLHHAEYGVYNTTNSVVFYFNLQKVKEVK
ncbi:sensor histidine kinase [Bacillus cereus group sp. BceL101]|uniref:histidine kinase n=14 Tax=Bacillus cereus group TaxID=86661 RepID=A0A9X8SGC6_BACCE|nr:MULTISPECIES: HAMP domain-containing sensor histidine kinase [Bacillus]ANN31655.1 two-component sensor histidine kinase [Bacillus thuringiensis serovar coreanensis]MBR3336630.1 HAMP domain-containing protein [Bacillus sp. (in: firmicutes)]MCO4214961.1 HAMP domain-containing histidine kinase [Bacillus sp. 10017]MEB4841596.1 HAMP domain-containing sensor histidine kinase [Paenibacillus jamilae]QQP81000.1 HAMP domain-containing protein [Bacillus sp. TK-2]WIL48850.1 HAMP domain-containing sens